MAAVAQGEIDKAELKKLLTKSKKEPVNCAVATDKGGDALIMLHKVKQPRALAKELERDFGEVRNPRFGSAFVDIDENPKLVILTLNKASPGLARKMKKTLKGTGFTKVRVVLEDGSVAEAVEEEEDEGEGDAPEPEGAEPPPPLDAAPEAAAATPGAAAAPAPPTIDVAEQARRLTELAKRMVQAIAADPSGQEALKALAVQAQNAVKARDAGAEALIDTFAAALDTALPAVQAPAAQAAMPPAAPFAKARLVWVAARSKVQGELDKLLAEMAATYKDHAFGADLDQVVRTKVEPMLESLDDRLAHKLDEVTAASDAATHARLVREARAIIGSYEAYIAGEPLIARLDANPFVPLQIEKTLSSTLAALARVLG